MKYLMAVILLAGPAIAMAKDDASTVGSSSKGDAAMEREFGSLNTGRVRNLSPAGSHPSGDAALEHEFGSLNTGRVRNLNKKP
ncbi:hypothetical protein NOV72_01423 [Caballeronia novacaledonica]|uniref:Uncharacterized protein n=1 Tax=Caballeronia novacaledonica TaxID=1544861 RepID=A0A2U3I228_9BURK|nr:hypothetical protein [Caballeronia novacaledonica]SPB14174.1 hypothetical protein NOV72_01423 [Caballeronia novacaledonica]